jgi:hypothetical protein
MSFSSDEIDGSEEMEMCGVLKPGTSDGPKETHEDQVGLLSIRR